jgi:hypothetical protein
MTGRQIMDTNLLQQIWKYFKEEYGYKIEDSVDLFETQRDLLKFVMGIGLGLEQSLFDEMGTGYMGRIISKGEKRFKCKGDRTKTIHGLFGMIEYKRAYYVSTEGGASFFPLDEKLGIEKKHTPGCNYFMSLFTSQGVYEKSKCRFHEIFRPEGKDLISMRKVLDMDYEVGHRLERIRAQEIWRVYEKGEEIERENVVEGLMAVSIDATKVREKLGEEIGSGGRKRYIIGFKDAKVATVSEVRWDKRRNEAKCVNTSYISAEEHADDFFKRIWVEMNRRSKDLSCQPIVFLGDGAEWIWNRTGDLANEMSIFILDFYHASEHLADLCKVLYGEETEEFWRYFNRWTDLFYRGKVRKVIDQMRKIMVDTRKQSTLKSLLGEINYFEENKDKMLYDKYRKMKLPIGSGTVESACKNVIGGRMKGGGMIWSPLGADGMLQIRSSVESGRFYFDFKQTLKMAS